MKDDELTVGFRQLGLAAENDLDEHPSEEMLADYLDGLLEPEQETMIREHLAVCPQCTQTLLILSGEISLVESESSDDDQAKVPPSSTQSEHSIQSQSSRRGQASLIIGAVAAVFLAFFLGLNMGGGGGPVDVAYARVQLLELTPGEVVRGDMGGAQGVAERVVLRLVLADAATYDQYFLEITDTGGEVLLEIEGLRRSADGSFVVDLPVAALASAAAFDATLYGIQESERVYVAAYRWSQ